jgi:NitT/TauT family transport system permease protein
MAIAPATIGRGAAQRRRASRSKSIQSASLLLLARVAVLMAMIALWWFVADRQLMDPTVTSSPKAVFSWLVDAVTGPDLWVNLGATMWATILAWVIAVVIGTVLGISLALLPRVEAVINPYLSAFNAMPRIALAPLFVVAFGLTIYSKVALAFSIVVFMAISSARAGVASVDLDLTRLSDVLGASKIQRFFKVLLPVAVPSIFGGMRLGLIYALLGTLTAELIGSVNGIGQMLQEAAGLFKTDEIYGLLIILAIVATALNGGMGYIERRLLRWQPPAGS